VAKKKTVFVCTDCGFEAAKWAGKCFSCGAWNTLKEIEIVTSKRKNITSRDKHTPVKISEVEKKTDERILFNIEEFNKVLGGGMVTGSMVLVGGEPGIGKSTLMLQVAVNYKGGKVLYISGEESLQQIKMRAERVSKESEQCYLLAETNLENILEQIKILNPDFVVIDSIQTLLSESSDSLPGSISQVKECAASLQIFAKETNIPLFIIGHITKDGYLAGPKVLEHIVDAVMIFEGDANNNFRILRSVKNRFGSTSELAVFDMKEDGLHEVFNPSESLLSKHRNSLSGNAVTVSLNGSRALLLEIQALVSNAVYGTPQRSSTGYDLRRLNILLAVLEKRGGYRLISKDVFINVVGGIKLDEPGNDLAVLAAIISSELNIPVSSNVCFAGEIGLSGEIRPISRLSLRANEAKRLGFKRIVVSGYANKEELNKIKGIEVVYVNDILAFYKTVFKGE
jgi:DNA repair protein RadA/Sms